MAQQCPQCSLVNPPIARRCDCGYDFVGRPSVSSPSIGIGRSPYFAFESIARSLVGSWCIGGPIMLIFGYDKLSVGALATASVFLLIVYATVLWKWQRQGFGFIKAVGRDTFLAFAFVLIGSAISGVVSASGGPALHRMGSMIMVFPLLGFLILQKLGRTKKAGRPS
jgi:hypothetical protein